MAVVLPLKWNLFPQKGDSLDAGACGLNRTVWREADEAEEF